MTGHERVARAHDEGPIDRADDVGGVPLTSLVRRSTEGLLRTAYLLCLDLDLAEDLVVRTWTEVARQWTAEVPRAAARPEAWARRLLVVLALEAQEAGPAARRPTGRDVLPSPSLVGRSGALSLQKVEDHLEVEFALRSLRPQQRAILVLRHHEGLDPEETASAIGCPVSVVQRTTHHLVHPGPSEAAAELLAETLAWQAAAVDADRVGAVTSRDYRPARGPARWVGATRPARRWPGRGWLATVLARRRGVRR